MTLEMEDYRKQVVNLIRSQCDREDCEKLLEDLDRCLGLLQEDTPEPDLQTLTRAFGSPEDLAQVLLEGNSPEKREKYLQKKRKLRFGAAILVGILAMALLAFSFYAIYIKESKVFSYYDVIRVEQEETVLATESVDAYEEME